MYIEFVIGYILTGVLALLLVAVIVLQCIILKKLSNSGAKGVMDYNAMGAYSGGVRGRAICRNCAAQFDAAQSACPRCGTPR